MTIQLTAFGAVLVPPCWVHGGGSEQEDRAFSGPLRLLASLPVAVHLVEYRKPSDWPEQRRGFRVWDKAVSMGNEGRTFQAESWSLSREL